MKIVILLFKSIYDKIFYLRILFGSAYEIPRILSKKYGFKVGENCRFTGKKISFGSEPYLIEIGNNVTITPGVKFETHDGGVGILRKEYPGINVFGRIKIGNNVFIGEDSMIMYGVSIGNDVVIGARSVVTKDIPPYTVAAGTPARVIRSLEEYKQRSLNKAIYVFSSSAKLRKKEILSKI